MTIEKGLKWPGETRKKGDGNCKYKVNATGRWIPFGFCVRGFSIRPLFPPFAPLVPFPLKKKKQVTHEATILLFFFCDELDNEKEKKQSLWNQAK